ncbi:MAG: energy-coupling factor transporter transmembrane component T [Bacteroidota bacterium]
MRFTLAEKGAWTLFLVVTAFGLPPLVNLCLALVLLILRQSVTALRPISPVAAKRFTRFLGFFGLLLLIMMAVNGVFIRTGDIVIPFPLLPLYEGGILFGATTGLRLLVIAIALLTFFGSTAMKDIAAGLERARVPSPLVITFLMTLQVLDRLPGRIAQIYTAQEARGAPVRANLAARIRAFFSILNPLVFSSMTESLDRGIALELRGFRGTYRFHSKFEQPERRSPVLALTFLVLTLLSLLWILFSWIMP